MPKITIDLPEDTNKKLKKKAKDNYRSLTNYITVALINLANESGNLMTNTEALEFNGRKIKSITYEKEVPAEEQELTQLKLQQKKDTMYQKRVEYFKKRYKEVFRGGATSRLQTICH